MQAPAQVTSSPSTAGSLHSYLFFCRCFQRSCRDVYVRNDLSCRLQLSVKNDPLTGVIFFFPGVLSSEDEGCRLTQECGPSQKCQPLCAKLQLRNLAKYKLYHLHSRPNLAAGSYFPKHVGTKGEKSS